MLKISKKKKVKTHISKTIFLRTVGNIGPIIKAISKALNTPCFLWVTSKLKKKV